MSEENKTKFGNMPLGMINKMLVSFIGEDAFFDYCKKYHEEGVLDWQSEEAFRKHLQRLFEEKESSYRDLNPHYDQSVYGIACKILGKFCDEYDLPKYIADTILDFYKLMTIRLSMTEYPIFETYYILDFVICGTLYFFVERTVSEIDKNNDISFSYLDAETKYNTVFDELGRQFESLEKFYRELDSYAGKIEHFKKIIVNYCKKGQNPAKWNDMKDILDFCKKEGKEKEMSRLIEAYITANVQNAIQKEIPPEKKDWNEIKSCLEDIITYLNENYLILPADLSDKLHQRVEMLHHILLDPLGDKSEPIELACLEILVNHVYLQDEKKFKDLLSDIKEIAPEAASFYCNWLQAYIAVAKGNFDKAKDFYNKAFSNIHFAGICARFFLKQAFALSVYCTDYTPKRDFRDTVSNAIDPEKSSQTPLPNDGKRFWEYGYAVGVFDKPAEEAFLEYVYRKENFSAEFPEEMFFPGKGIDFNKIKLYYFSDEKEALL